MKRNFKRCSNKERELTQLVLESQGITEFYFTNYDSRYEGNCVSPSGRNIIFEVKCRRFKSTKYRTTFIEKDKYEYLQKKAKETNSIPFLFIFFSDKKFIAIDLSKQWGWDSRYKAPVTTVGYDRTFIQKQFREFPIEKIRNTPNKK